MIDESIVLVDDDGVEHSFTFYDTVDVGDLRYVILIPVDGDGEEGVVFRIESEDEENEEMTLVSVLDDEELDAVIAALEEQELDE
ncbi:MAG: DUF1292 domain-containing protein [Limnochordia bacterium]|jgi:uncharacterized protein YrzB (UPF0473 family)